MVIPAPGVAVSDRAKVDLILSQLEVESTGTRGLLLAATLAVSASVCEMMLLTLPSPPRPQAGRVYLSTLKR